MSEPNPQALKNLYNVSLLRRMAGAISAAYPTFDQKKFVSLMRVLEPLEMKPRVRYLRDALHAQLPASYPQALKILLRSTHAGELKGFDLWPYTEFVQHYGLDHLELSLSALRELTPRFTSEFAIRPFIQRYPAETLQFLTDCAQDAEDEHVRRWASEGTRPRLPWGERLHDFVRDPAPGFAILEHLKFDSALYVRKSVANHLNDIAKDHPERVVQALKRWRKLSGELHKEKIGWIMGRALRTLIKAGHPGALELMGVSTEARLEVTDLKLASKRLKLGERLQFDFSLRSLEKRPQKIVIDYCIHFVKANGTLAPKVFKLKNTVIAPQETIELSKRHHLKKITTRDYYPGKHRLEIQVNGRRVADAEWTLRVD